MARLPLSSFPLSPSPNVSPFFFPLLPTQTAVLPPILCAPFFYPLFSDDLTSCASFQFFFFRSNSRTPFGGSVPSPQVLAAFHALTPDTRVPSWLSFLKCALYLPPIQSVLRSNLFGPLHIFAVLSWILPALFSYFPPCSTLNGSFTLPENQSPPTPPSV